MERTGKQFKSVYTIGAIATIIVLCGIVLDIIVGSFTVKDITFLPDGAIERFAQFKSNWLLGLYSLDLLNVINQIILIPSIFAIYIAHKKINEGMALLALILFLVGTTLFVAGNTALSMFDLSKKYFSASSESQMILIAAAGEAMLARGAHGSPGVFIGFTLPTIASVLMSYVMIKGQVFSKANSYIGFIGNLLMLLYLVLVTFFPAIEKHAILIAIPGGLLVMTWMIMYTIRLFKIRLTES
ncbi:MAG: DUF4386 family protein [Bacteroidales bacterium]|nr:DUF4386 family protein [Bacteroidales bacterium]